MEFFLLNYADTSPATLGTENENERVSLRSWCGPGSRCSELMNDVLGHSLLGERRHRQRGMANMHAVAMTKLQLCRPIITVHQIRSVGV